MAAAVLWISDGLPGGDADQCGLAVLDCGDRSAAGAVYRRADCRSVVQYRKVSGDQPSAGGGACVGAGGCAKLDGVGDFWAALFVDLCADAGADQFAGVSSSTGSRSRFWQGAGVGDDRLDRRGNWRGAVALSS